MAVQLIPEGPRAVTPYLTCKGAAGAIEFYKKAFGAKESMRLAEPGGRIGHAEITISDSPIMLSDEYLEMGVTSPQSLGGTSVTIHLYVEDVDATFRRAIGAGAKEVRPVTDQFYGDRSGSLLDPFGHRWMIATRKEDISSAEMTKRYAKLTKHE